MENLLVMDTTKLVVGQSVFMRSGEVGGWATVVEVTPTGVIVQASPDDGEELIRFDKNGIACDSSDIDIDRYKNLVLFDFDETAHLVPAPCDVAVDVERVKAVVSKYDKKGFIPFASSVRGTDRDRRKFRQRFWESFECLKTHSRYRKTPGTSRGPWELYLHW